MRRKSFLFEARCCCINLARAGSVYAPRSGASPLCLSQLPGRNFLIFSKKCARTYARHVSPKGHYHVRNWAAYNAGLIHPGNVTI
ncbi:MAG: hypothetical protein E5299_00206 [Burkholderia gladioli]|nr:MAG: hypothetical protein E5299_00206 [Burkholderia gladioli]